MHVFTILARILNDPELGNTQEGAGYTTTVTEHGATFVNYMKDWHVDPTNPRDIERKVEELSWLNSLLYAVGGSQPGKPFKADFFLFVFLFHTKKTTIKCALQLAYGHIVTLSSFLHGLLNALFEITPPQELSFRIFDLVGSTWPS